MRAKTSPVSGRSRRPGSSARSVRTARSARTYRRSCSAGSSGARSTTCVGIAPEAGGWSASAEAMRGRTIAQRRAAAQNAAAGETDAAEAAASSRSSGRHSA
ncbi:MAG: hypothetical protein ACK56I_26065, partial [bacterium]